MFAQCVSLDSYQVFLQAYGSGEIALTGRYSDHFVISGTPGLSFGWEIKAKQIDYDQLRMTEDETFITGRLLYKSLSKCVK